MTILRPLSIVMLAGMMGTAALAAATENNSPATAAQQPLATPAKSKDKAANDNGMDNSQPIDITATNGLEWHQNEHLYVAKGNAHVKRGTETLDADKIVAYERDKAKPAATAANAQKTQSPAEPGALGGGGNTEIWRIVADGHVHLTNKRADGQLQEAFGDHAVYDIDTELAILKGKNLHAQTPTSVVTAQDSLEYWKSFGMAVARGNATAWDKENQRKVFADTLIAIFKEDPHTHQQKLDHAEAHGHVIIVTATDYAKAEFGRYDEAADKAWLSGHVHITHGKSQMNGDNAEMDLATNVTRLSLDPAGKAGSEQRVTGLYLPEDSAKTAKKVAPRAGAPAAGAALATPSTTTPATGIPSP